MRSPRFYQASEGAHSVCAARLRLVQDNLANTLNSFVQEICPVSRPLKRESQRRAKTVAGSAD
jgi:hypothetical protein